MPGACKAGRAKGGDPFRSTPPLTKPGPAVMPDLSRLSPPGDAVWRAISGTDGPTSLAWRLLRREQSSEGHGDPYLPPRIAFVQMVLLFLEGHLVLYAVGAAGADRHDPTEGMCGSHREDAFDRFPLFRRVPG